jgi:hypothetical protein
VSQWFVHPNFLALGALISVPLLIHILFRLRPPIVKWPAMEFLRRAMKKTRQRTRLEQLLLLALRMFIVAVATMLIARPMIGEELTSLLDSGPAAEHFVVLDDTLSMGEIAESEAIYTVGVRNTLRMVDRLAERPGRSRLTIFATSKPQQAIFPTSAIDAEKAAAIRRELENAKPSSLARSPDAALERAAESLLASDASLRVLHVVGDFRSRDWPADGAAMKTIRRAAQSGIHLSLIDATPETRNSDSRNLGIERLTATSAPTAVGVPIDIEAVIVNHSDRVAEDAAVEWRLDGKPTPRTIVKSIPAGGTAVAQTSLTPRDAGLHAVSAQLPADSLPGDDERWLALNVVDRAAVLIVDGDERQRDARFLAAALDPGGNVHTGWAPTIRPIEAIRQPGLSRFPVLLFANVPDFSSDDAKILSKYVQQGGSVCWFVGDSTTPQGWKNLATANLLPAVIRGSEATSARNGADRGITVVGEFLRGLAKVRGSFLDDVSVSRRVAVEDRLPEGAGVFLKAKDGTLLAVSRTVGKGRTAIVLTTAGPTWNNWPTNPSYVVFLLELCSSLSTPTGQSRLVGERWELEIDPAQYRRTASLASSDQKQSGEQPVAVEPGSDGLKLSTPPIEVQGVYEMALQTLAGDKERRGTAFNVDSGEGDLKKAAPSLFATALAGRSYRMAHADADDDEGPSRSSEFRDVLILLLLAALIAEQFWARRCTRRAA